MEICHFHRNKIMSYLNKFYYKKSRLQQLKGFCSVIECGSIKKAGNKLNLDSSTISIQVKSLEIDLGVKLIYKFENKILPTKVGTFLYEKASDIIKNVDELFSNFIINKHKNYLNIAIQPIFLEYLIKILYMYINENTNIDINLLARDKISDMILKEEIDLFFCNNINDIQISNEIKIEKIVEYKCVDIYFNNQNYQAKKIDFNDNININNCLTFGVLKEIAKQKKISISVPKLCLYNETNNFSIKETKETGYLFCIYKKNNCNNNIDNILEYIKLKI